MADTTAMWIFLFSKTGNRAAMPLVSVIIPTYNRASVLDRAILSVLGQTMRDYECIVVDDASSDSTPHLIGRLPHAEAVRYIRLPFRKGVSAARNAGVAAASAPWLAFLDSDDEWHSSKLEKQMEWHCRNPAIRVSQTQEIWIRRGVRVNPPATHRKAGGLIFEASLARCMVTPSSVLLEKNLFLEEGGFNEALPACEDYDLWLRITCAHSVGLIDEFLLTRYGGHADQLSATVGVLDRFRIQSIMDLLQSSRLSLAQADKARVVLAKKAAIVANGCKKRGIMEEYERYAHIAGIYGPVS